MRELAIGLIGLGLTGGAMHLFEAGKNWPGIFMMVMIFVCIIICTESKSGDKNDGNDSNSG